MFKDKVVVLSGAGSGISRELALQFTEAVARLACPSHWEAQGEDGSWELPVLDYRFIDLKRALNALFFTMIEGENDERVCR
jgi:NAD(P)-dependent dehydrogenase (short-subunit alcohol dehydrogenase family)